ncbi:hypothetical protein [Microcoleus sp. herbarium12]|jgi:hypothetical protein|uniref:hypothetical protein n=1 Tax=Microcoleus sp. herbarium12 TaxID=3055437 RepID=UPI002FD5CB3C
MLYSVDFQCSSNNGCDTIIYLVSDESKAEISPDRDREFGDRIINRRTFPQTSIEGVRSASIPKLLLSPASC